MVVMKSAVGAVQVIHGVLIHDSSAGASLCNEVRRLLE